MKTVTLTKDQAAVLLAFCESFDLVTTGAWAPISEAMETNFGIADPEGELEAAKEALQG